MKTSPVSPSAPQAPSALSAPCGSTCNLQPAPCNPGPAPTPPRPHSALPSPHCDYVLCKGLGFWELTFQGRSAPIKHEQGLYYVACLLLNPPAEPIHGLALSLKAAALYGRPIATPEILDPLTGKAIPLALDSPIQQRSLGIEEADAAFALRRKQLELEAILDDEGQSEPVKGDVLRELEAIYAYQKQIPGRSRDAGQKAVRAVRMALVRLYRHLALGLDAGGRPHPVLRRFAEHLREHLLIPSGRYIRRAANPNRTDLAGCFTYEPPPGVLWRASVPPPLAPEAPSLTASPAPEASPLSTPVAPPNQTHYEI